MSFLAQTEVSMKGFCRKKKIFSFGSIFHTLNINWKNIIREIIKQNCHCKASYAHKHIAKMSCGELKDENVKLCLGKPVSQIETSRNFF